MKNQNLNRDPFTRKKIPILLVACLLSIVTFAQEMTVSGTVSDQTGPLPGVNVLVAGSSNGVATDFDGKYTINNVSSDATLIFSSLGYLSQEVQVNGRTSINITLLENLEEMDEVIVVAYGNQSREEVTGAISTVDSEDITATPIATADQALQGRAAGVSVINNGSPGVAPSVRIRGISSPTGNGEPLYVIDGVISTGLGNLNPNDIETINVLKDASTAAAYGSQASNGVVIVTTKRGKPGKVQVSYNAYTGVQYTTERYDLLNNAQYLQFAEDAFGFTPSSPLSSSGLNTDWQDAIFQQGIIQNHDLAVAGGGENSDFRISGSFLDQEGTLIETGFTRYNFRANSNFSIGRFRIGETLSISFSDQNPERQDGGRSLIEHAIKSAPYLPIYNSDNLGGFQGPNSALDGQDARNPVAAQSLGYIENKVVDIFGNVYGEVDIFEGLKFRTQLGLQNTTTRFNSFIPSYNDDSEGATHAVGFAQIQKNYQNFRRILFTNSFNYEFNIADKHNFDILLLAEQNKSEFEQITTSSENAITNDVDQVSNDASNLGSISDVVNKIGYLARLNYNFEEKYLLAASIRRDASSRFGLNKKWGNFPSLALGWNIAKEDFLSNSDITTLKLRGSWGTTGFDNIDNYQFNSTLISSFAYPLGGVAAVGTSINGRANPNIAWEEKTMKNIGLDFGYNNNQFTATVEYYINTSDELLIGRPLPPSRIPNRPDIVTNVGSSETKGWEFILGYNDYDGDFTWSANINIGTQDNEMKSLGLGGDGEIFGALFENSPISRIATGEPLFHFYGLVTDGIYQNQAEVDAVLTANPDQETVQPGDIRFKDLNNDGQINSDDRAVIGNPYADVTYGFNFNANYKNWDMNLFINGVAGRDIFNTNIYDLEGMPRLFNAGTAVLNRWTGPGTSNSVPRAAGAPQNTAISDRYVEDGSFTRLKNIAIGYTFNEGAIGDWIPKLRIYVSGQNLITLTDYSGLDPEVGSSNVINNNVNEFGIDRGNYPQPKSLLIGIQAQF